MRVDPVLLLHGAAGLCITIHAEGQRCHKQINLTAVARYLVIKLQRGPSPVNHQLIAGFMLDMHGKIVLGDIILI